MNLPSPTEWQTFPMGPSLRRLLGVAEEDYQGEGQNPSPEKQQAFADRVGAILRASPPTSQAEFVDLCEELTAMGYSSLCLRLAEANPQWDVSDDFRALLAIGSAAMMEGDLEEAERFLSAAHHLATEEPAPYVNLTGLCYAQERDDEAWEWAVAGLRVDPDNRRLWEIIYSIALMRDPGRAKDLVKTLAEENNSYAGLAIAAELLAPQDALLKAQYLERLYHQGHRQGNFLVEYTAALGLAQDYRKIPAILWEAAKVSGQGQLPWQLYTHAVQAHLALEEHDQAAELIDKVSQMEGVPAHVLTDLRVIYEQNPPVH